MTKGLRAQRLRKIWTTGQPNDLDWHEKFLERIGKTNKVQTGEPRTPSKGAREDMLGINTAVS